MCQICDRRNSRVRALYYLYQQYHAAQKVTMLSQSDFESGTYRITTPGLYVLCEHIVFNPSTPPDLQPTRYGHPAYSMGYFAALTIECDGVILNLNGHTMQQSYEHYFTQRFFSLIELANSPFVLGQGPGTLNTTDNANHALTPATNCLILNGTLGLSSHSAVHGNNNRNVVLQNLCLTQFEVAGVQLNGVHHAYVEDVQMTSITTAPLGDSVFSFLRHFEELQDLDDAGTPPTAPTHPTVDAAVALAAAEQVFELLAAPFEKAATEDPLQLAVAAKLEQIWTELRATVANCENTPGDPPLFLDKFVNGTGIPDGSALYGVLINSSGVAVGEIAAACPMAAQHDGTCRRSREVTLHRVTMNNFRLHAVETIGMKTAATADPSATLLNDKTGALIKVGDAIACPNWLLSHLRILLNAKIRDSTGAPLLAEMLLGVKTFAEFTAASGVTFVSNADVMAHVAKGIFGVRAEETDHLLLQKVHAEGFQNTSMTPVALDLPTPPVPLTLGSPDATMALNFTGNDIRVVLLANSTSVNAHQTCAKAITSTHGMVRVVELENVQCGSICQTVADAIVGVCRMVVHLQPTCQQLQVRDVQCKNTSAKTTQQALDDLEALLEEDNPNLRSFVRRWITVDPTTLSVECPCTLDRADIK